MPTSIPAVVDLPRVAYQHYGERCADGTHLVIVPVLPMPAVQMRGVIPMSVLNSTRMHLHNVRVSYVIFGSKKEDYENSTSRIEAHFRTYGEPSACVLIKYSDPQAAKICRRHGAVVLLDCVDNFRCFLVGRKLIRLCV